MSNLESNTDTAISVQGLDKVYAGGKHALHQFNLEVGKGEIIALLGPNGAGKTTLISIICGLVTPSQGTVKIYGHDIVTDYRASRQLVGLVPQELTTDSFETPANSLHFTRGLFGLPRDEQKVEQVLRDLSLWDKRDARIMALSGGMKRRLLIAKALVHEPKVLFLDEPTAGVDVNLRQDMWRLVAKLREQGVTIVLTTHYIEEAEAIADRIGVINGGRLLLLEEKTALMRRLGQKELVVELTEKLDQLTEPLAQHGFVLSEDGKNLVLRYQQSETTPDIASLLQAVDQAGLKLADLHTAQSSLEDIFVNLLKESAA